MIYLLYNDFADNNHGKEDAEKAAVELKGKIGEAELISLVDLDLNAFAKKLGKDDSCVLMGGDGTLNHFINSYEGEWPSKLSLFPMGTGNDFLNDVKDSLDENGLVPLNEYLKDLPIIEVKGEKHKFINGIGYGIDGECCVVADEMKARGEKKINYSSITIKLLLGKYKAPNCTLIVDGVEQQIKKAYLASAMNGRFYGGGMMIAPPQKRGSHLLSAVVVHGKGKLGTLFMFPNITKGKHLKYKKNVTLIQGKEIIVRFDRPTGLQIDGEVVKDVSEYKAYIA